MSGLVSFCLKNRFLVLIGAVLAIAIAIYVWTRRGDVAAAAR